MMSRVNNYIKVINGYSTRIEYVFFDDTDSDSVALALVKISDLRKPRTRLIAFRKSMLVDRHVDGVVGDVIEARPTDTALMS